MKNLEIINESIDIYKSFDVSFSTFKRIFFKPYPNKPTDNINPKTGRNSENCSMIYTFFIILFYFYYLSRLIIFLKVSNFIKLLNDCIDDKFFFKNLCVN